MTVKAFRLTKSVLISSALSGEGASKYGGRWNSPGVKIVYTSSTLSLAVLEIMVHLDDYSLLCKNYRFIPIEIPPELISATDPKGLPVGWNSESPGVASQQIGDLWVAKMTSAVLSVPTMLLPDELNYLLNPLHPDFSKIVIGKDQKLCFDPRFIK